MTKPRAGSYDAGPPSSREAERLRAQAAVIWGRERSALARAGLVEGTRLLEVGCGPGGVLERLAPDLGRTPFGIDLDQSLLRRARVLAHLARGDGAALPFGDGTFDFVLLRLVLRHAPQRARLLDEAARVTRVGGTVAAIDVDEEATAFDPEPPTWQSLKRALIESAKRRGGDPLVGRRLERLLTAAGLSDRIVVMLPVTTQDLAPPAFIETLLAPTMRVVDTDCLAASATEAAWRELREWAALEVGFGYALGVMAAAKKPAHWRAQTVAIDS